MFCSFFFFSSRRRHTRYWRDWSSDVCSSDLCIDAARLTHELVRRLIGRLIEDVVSESTRRVSAAAPMSSDEVRAAGTAVIGFSPMMASTDRAIKEFLWTNMYRHPRVLGVLTDAEEVVRKLFARFFVQPQDMPGEWAQGLEGTDAPARARRVAD